jgi:hypothetical protein
MAAYHTLSIPHSTQFSGGVCPHSSEASGGENLEVEEPVACWDCSSLDFHPTLPSMLSTALVGDQVVEVRQTSQKRLLTPVGMMKPLHHEQLPVEGVVGLIQQRARHRHLRVCQHRIPTGFTG